MRREERSRRRSTIRRENSRRSRHSRHQDGVRSEELIDRDDWKWDDMDVDAELARSHRKGRDQHSAHDYPYGETIDDELVKGHRKGKFDQSQYSSDDVSDKINSSTYKYECACGRTHYVREEEDVSPADARRERMEARRDRREKALSMIEAEKTEDVEVVDEKTEDVEVEEKEFSATESVEATDIVSESKEDGTRRATSRVESVLREGGSRSKFTYLEEVVVEEEESKDAQN